MTTLTAFTIIVVLFALERLAEVVVAKRNTAWSMARGGRESGQGHYPPMVLLHTGFLIAMLVEAYVVQPDVAPALAWTMVVLVVAAQGVRVWCIVVLGHHWNTRIIVVPGMVPVRSGPYRLFAQPNYGAVVVEGIALPMIHAAWITAVGFTILNAALLTVRIRAENAALASLPHIDGSRVAQPRSR